MALSPCKTKLFYDTEFAATIAAAKSEHKYQSAMKAYKCPEGNHYHIANVDSRKWSRNNKASHRWCRYCSCYLKPGRWERHINTVNHQIRREKWEPKKKNAG